MNLLDFITNDDLNDIENLITMPVSFQMINLHTENFEKAKLFHEKAKAIRPRNPSVIYNEKFFLKT